jgi:hypothetical protein
MTKRTIAMMIPLNRTLPAFGTVPLGQKGLPPQISAQDLNLPDWNALRTRDPATNSTEVNAIVRNMDILEQMEQGLFAPGLPIRHYAEQIAEAIDTLYSYIEPLREATFETVNDHSREVYGRLREGKTAKDREEYVTRLGEYLTVSDATSRFTRYCADQRSERDCMQHRSFLLGYWSTLMQDCGVPDLPSSQRGNIATSVRPASR